MSIEGSECDVCRRGALPLGRYCRIHDTALREIRKGFGLWEKAIANLSWERYLESISELKETGEASKELANHLLKQIK